MQRYHVISSSQKVAGWKDTMNEMRPELEIKEGIFLL